MFEGNISLESIKWSAIEAIWKLVGVDVELSILKMIAESSKSGSTSAKGLIGHDFEDYLTKNIGGYGSFSVGGRDFNAGKQSLDDIRK